MNLIPTSAGPFVHGPETSDTAGLRRWLGLLSSGQVVRLPVNVHLGAARSTVAGGHVLTGAGDGLALSLDDSRLGISLADRAQQACPGQDSCALWLEGTWSGEGLQVTRSAGPASAAAKGAPLFAGLEVPGARSDLAALVEALGGDASLEEKRTAGQALLAAGLDAALLLVASLHDGRTYETRDAANRLTPPPQAKVEPVVVASPVAHRCEDLLYALVTPAAPDAVQGNFKVLSEQKLRVKDWAAFFAARKGRTLAQIHDELRPLVKAYWDGRGTTQDVP